MTPANRTARTITALVALPLAAAIALTGCAPEPGTGPDVDGGSVPESVQPPVEGETGPEIGPKPTKTAELPASFPLDLVPLDPNAVIDDAGERGENAWFAVLRYEDAAAAGAALDALIQAGAFAVVSDESGLPGERSASLETAQLQVGALIAPAEDSDGQTLLSLDVAGFN